MSVTLTNRATIVDRFIPRSISADIALVALGALLTAGAAQISIPMWPVPITGQTFAVLLVGAALGATRGAISMAFYVLLGAVGLPVFAAGKSGFVFGPTLGYLFGFIAAGAVVGYFAEREIGRKWFSVAVGFVAGNAIIYAFGLPWLSIFLGANSWPNDLNSTLVAGLYPFILGDALKIALASTLLPGAWALAKKLKG
ncbi:MAG: biotin transporter BioY [Rhodoluna sp.]|nr:biotin transporter BioY [Rhodoluna sp.]